MDQWDAGEGATRLRQNPPRAQRESHDALLGAFQKHCWVKHKHRKKDSNSSLIRDSHLYFLNLGPRNMKLCILIYHGLYFFFFFFFVGDQTQDLQMLRCSTWATASALKLCIIYIKKYYVVKSRNINLKQISVISEKML